jgi:hypothetical protein
MATAPVFQLASEVLRKRYLDALRCEQLRAVMQQDGVGQ